MPTPSPLMKRPARNYTTMDVSAIKPSRTTRICGAYHANMYGSTLNRRSDDTDNADDLDGELSPKAVQSRRYYAGSDDAASGK